MKKLNVTQMENLQGGLLTWSNAAGGVCTAAVLGGLFGVLALGPACGALIAISIWG